MSDNLPQAAGENKSTARQQDLHLINDLQQAMLDEKHYATTITLWLLVAFVASFIAWAYVSVVEEIVRGQGTVIPSSREQVIESLDPGVVEKILVKEGDIVNKGQVLIKLDATRSSGMLEEVRSKNLALQATAARLRAEAFGGKLSFAKHIPSEIVKTERQAYRARTQTLKDFEQSLTEGKKLLDREIAITKPMVKKGVVSELELLRLQRESNDLQRQLIERLNQFKTEANTKLLEVEAELAQTRQNITVRQDPVSRTAIKSPMRGVVKNIRVNTVGGVIGQGEDIMEIVPLDGPLLVQAYIRPADVAFIKPNDLALIKLSAYDYSLYGGLEGRVEIISPDTLKDDRRSGSLNLNPEESYYRVIIRTEGAELLDKNNKPMPIIPGMIANVDIKTGEKTIFQYLTKPITRMKQALQER